MNSGATKPARERGISVEQYLRAAGLGQRQELCRQALETLDRPGFFTQFHQAHAAAERLPGAAQELLFAEILGHRDSIDQWQRKCVQDRLIRRQQRRDLESARHLPGDRLSIAADRLAAPGEDAEEIELDVGVRVW